MVLQPPLPLQVFLPLQPASPVLQPPWPLQRVLAFAVVLAVVESSASWPLAAEPSWSVGDRWRRGLDARGGAGHQPGEGDGGEHGFGGLKETWIFHVNTSLSFSQRGFC